MSDDLKKLCRFYESVKEIKIAQNVVNELMCNVRRQAWDLGCGCYNCSQCIQHHAKWQPNAQLNSYKTQSRIDQLK
jgi:hypothetical protein